MTDFVSSCEEMLASLQAEEEARQFDGARFEDAVCRYASEIPSWEIARCWRYPEWPDRTTVDVPLPQQDMGIDLVAEKRDGSRVAIQCKARSGAGSITTKQVQQFAGAAPAKVFTERWFVAAAHRSAATEDAAVAADVTFIDFETDLRNTLADVRERERADGETDPRTAMQEEAVAACVKALRAGLPEHRQQWLGTEPADWMPEQASRATLVLPCGTGKTRVSMQVMSELSEPGDIGVVLVPSIALIAQVRREYLSHIRRPVRTLAVCSDKTAGHVRDKEDPNLATDPTRDTGQVHAADVGCRVVQDAGMVSDWLRAGTDRALHIIFSTYQSARHTAEALRREHRYAQVLVLDEAHRTAQLRPVGASASQSKAERLRVFTMCHDQNDFPARYRLYQTATPRVYDASNRKIARIDRTKWLVASMSDQAIFGPVAFRLPYRKAVEKNLLADYRIIAFGVDERAWNTANRIVKDIEQSPRGRGLTTREVLSWLVYGVVLAGGAVGSGGPVSVSRSLAFLNRVQRSGQMVNWLSSPEGRSTLDQHFTDAGIKDERREYRVEHLDAGHPVRARRQALHALAQGDGATPRGIANVGIFSEGTDSPNLDAVALLAPRRSPTDVIQIVGRCMRRAPGKQFGYVIVPVPLPRGIDAEMSLSMDTLGEEWKVLGEVLRALRAHDGRIEDEISRLLEIHMPPEDEQPVRQPMVVRDGTVTRLGFWTGPRGRVEDAVAEAEVPPWRPDPETPVTEYLTPDRGFQWREEPISADTPARFTDGPPGADERMLEETPAVLVLQRRSGGVRCTTQPVERSLERRGGVDVAKTVEQARATAWHSELLSRRPRRRLRRASPDTVRPSGPSREQRLFELLRQDGAGRDLRVEVMEKSGLRGNELRDFNLLMEPVRRAAACLRAENLEPRLRSVLGMEHLKEADTHADACTVSVLLLMNAALLHARLEDAGGGAAALVPVGSLGEVETAGEPVAIFREAWTAVLRYDYEPVFQPALEILEALARADASGGVNQAVRSIASWVKENAGIYASMGMEYAGELFSRVLGNQASDGAFFTRQTAARLLAELALDAVGETAWADRKTWRRLRMADLACGSGTLLNAYLEVVKERIQQDGGDEQTAAEFHKYAVERLVTGLDINPVSLQLAAGRMTLGNTSVDYRKMGLRALPYGPVEGGVRLGSLELLTDEDVVGPVATSTADGGGQGQAEFFESFSVDPEVVQDVEDRRIVMMNPPFTANDKKGRKFTPKVTKDLQKRELRIRDRLSAVDPEAGGVIDANSISTMFTPLAEKILSEDGGVLAKIMPVTACTGASGLRERRFLASRFHIDMIVCSHDPREPNLSAHTSINECLLIATRETLQPAPPPPPPTKFLNLLRFPKTMDDVRDVISAIRNQRFEEIGNVCEWPADLVQEGDWSPVQWFDPELARAALKVRNAPTVMPLSDLYHTGPAGRRIHDAYQRVTDGSSTGSDVAVFDSVSSAHCVSLAGNPDAIWRPKAGKESLAARYVRQRGWAMLANRADVHNARVAGMCASKKSFGSGFMPIITGTLSQAKALILVWNSTPVLVQLLNMRSKKLMYLHWSVAQLRSVRVPVSLGDTEQQAALVAVYDRLCRERLQPWAQADTDPIRQAIDDAVSDAFGLSSDVLADWRARLAREPTVANQSPP